MTKAAAGTAGQWKDWYWACFGGIIFFLLCIPLMRGRWKPSAVGAAGGGVPSITTGMRTTTTKNARCSV